MSNIVTGNQIRQEFIDFFIKKGHHFVPSSSLVPGGDKLFYLRMPAWCNLRMFSLETDKRNYTRAVNSQKCMRVAGKHNDLDDVGRDRFASYFL